MKIRLSILALLAVILCLQAPTTAQITLPPASDRFAWNPDYRDDAGRASNWVLYSSIGWETVRTFTGDHKSRDAWRQACTFSGGQGGAQLSKWVFRRLRPDGSDTRSFFSGHTASAPRWYFAIPVGELRIGAGRHDWIDVLAGGLVGGAARWGCERWIR